MRIFDKKIVTLKNGKDRVNVSVYLKEVKVRNNHTAVKSYCKILD